VRGIAIFFCALMPLLGAAAAVSAGSQAGFPQQLTVDARGRTHELVLTGLAERVFLIFRVYDMAHYIDASSMTSAALTPRGVLQDGPAKAIAIVFARTLRQEQIRKEFDRSLRRNAQAEWLEKAGATIRRFTASIDRDATEGDRLTFYWLPDGRVLTEFNGQRVFSADDPAFAKLVWSIWFGRDPVCNVDDLLARTAFSRL
jgi:hypothetical protein